MTEKSRLVEFIAYRPESVLLWLHSDYVRQEPLGQFVCHLKRRTKKHFFRGGESKD